MGWNGIGRQCCCGWKRVGPALQIVGEDYGTMVEEDLRLTQLYQHTFHYLLRVGRVLYGYHLLVLIRFPSKNDKWYTKNVNGNIHR